MMFFRLCGGCFLQLLPFAFICLYPFKNNFRLNNKKIVVYSTLLVLILSIIFATLTIPLSKAVGIDYSFAAANGVFLLCLFPCLMWYLYVVKDIWQKKLFVFSFAVMSGAAMILLDNTITTYLQKDIEIDNLPYHGIALPILLISTLIALPLILLILKKGFMPTENYLTKKDYTGLFTLSLVLLMLLFSVFLPIDFSLVTEIISLVPYIAIVVAIFIIYYVFFRIFGLSKNRLIAEKELAQAKLNYQTQSEQYNKLIDKISETRRIRHDSKHHFVTLNQYLINNDTESALKYLENQIEKIDKLTLERYCENDVINALLSYYSNVANESGINITINAICPQNIDVDSSDLTIIIGNLLDNAYTAAKEVASNRFINLNIIKQGKMLAITVDNSFNGLINVEQKIYRSTKENHTAIGLESIKQIADKYYGGTEFSNEENIFHSSVMLRAV